MIPVIFLVSTWITQIKVTPDSSNCGVSQPFIVADYNGKCWFCWADQNFGTSTFIRI
jgi:hypothetical protein